MQLPPRVEMLALKTGLRLGLLPEADRRLVLALAACAIEPGRHLREDEANRRLVDWLADVGQMLATDHVELRRWLIDSRFVTRDDWGHAYARGPGEVEQVRQLLGTTDVAGIFTAVRSARIAAQSARLARRRAYEAGGGSALTR